MSIEIEKQHPYRFSAILACLVTLFGSSAWAQSTRRSTTAPTYKDELPAEKLKLIPLLESDDPAQVQEGIAGVGDWAAKSPAGRRGQILQLLVDTKHFAEAENMGLEFARLTPNNGTGLSGIQKMRTQSLLAQGKNKEALSASRAYFNVCRLKETSEAITLIGTCLAAVYPNDPGIVQRFTRQQLALANAPAPEAPDDPAGNGLAADGLPAKISVTQPSTARSDPSLGELILPSIPINEPEFSKDADNIVPTTFATFTAKGNLLLLAGRPDEAMPFFKRAYEMATDKRLPEAIENVARCIRAQTCSVGQANAYLQSVQNKRQG